MAKDKQISQSRREFLQKAGATGGVAAAAVSIPGAVLAETPTQENSTADAPEGYRLTKHILAYYKSATR
jgi:hypothetical protein